MKKYLVLKLEIPIIATCITFKKINSLVKFEIDFLL
jgi:hypothetical protein